MSTIVVDDQQAQLIAQGTTKVQIRDRNDRLLGYIVPSITEAELVEIKRRLASGEPKYTTQQVLDYLHSLDQS